MQSWFLTAKVLNTGRFVRLGNIEAGSHGAVMYTESITTKVHACKEAATTGEAGSEEAMAGVHGRGGGGGGGGGG